MRVTRSWLSEFIDLGDVSIDTLYKTFNSIGLEVDTLVEFKIPPKVVVGKIISCAKHPDADKLNVCQIDIGTQIKQIVCGAANVVNATYVAVATIGAVLPEDFHIKPAKLRGVESEGMVCSSTELGLPTLGDGIMILDESIGELVVGRELRSYSVFSDTVIELELTANRGDCLSIYGVARDLSVALKKPLHTVESPQIIYSSQEIESFLAIQTQTIDAQLLYVVAEKISLKASFLVALRLAMVEEMREDILDAYLAYATHATGVLLRAYEMQTSLIDLEIRTPQVGIVEVVNGDEILSVVGVNQNQNTFPKEHSKIVLLEASYSDPDMLVEAVAQTKLSTDALYYQSSRGSSPDLAFGMTYLQTLLQKKQEILFAQKTLKVGTPKKPKNITIDTHEIADIIGAEIRAEEMVNILARLGFAVTSQNEHRFVLDVPLFRHDIHNIQDIAEEIVRIVGINHIKAKPLTFAEQNRTNATLERYYFKKALRNRAVGCGFYENVSYLFTHKMALEKYGFNLIDESLELSNPIAEEFNTLRSTLLTNLLFATQRNINYSIKSIPLFEIGAVFNTQREQREMMALIWCGEKEPQSIRNQGKPTDVTFGSFTQLLGGVIGAFELKPCSSHNGLIHPYQSADIIRDGKVCGYLSKLHPIAQEALDLPVTFIAEMAFDALLPHHINAKPISNFQGVYKDLSIVIDKSVGYGEIANVIKGLTLPMLKNSFSVDVYQDASLGEKKSLTIRFFIQSMEDTLKESEIEYTMQTIIEALHVSHQAVLR